MVFTVVTILFVSTSGSNMSQEQGKLTAILATHVVSLFAIRVGCGLIPEDARLGIRCYMYVKTLSYTSLTDICTEVCVSLAIFVPLASYSFYSDWLVNLLRTKGSSKHQPVDKPTTTPPPSRKRSLQPPPDRGLERLSLDSKKAAVSVHVRPADGVAEEDLRGWKSDFKWPLRRARTYKSHDIEALSPGK